MKNAWAMVTPLFLVALFFSGCANPLITAAREGDIKELERLIAAGADVNPKHMGVTPLYVAIQHGQVNAASLLIEKGADVNAKENDGSTPLHNAVYYGYADAARLLIKKGAEVNARNGFGRTPLLYADDANVASLLIENGADVNAKENDGSTSLHNAAHYGRAGIVALLLSKGADPDIANNEGKTPLKIAQERGNGNIAMLLKKDDEPAGRKPPAVVASGPASYPAVAEVKSDVDQLPYVKAKSNKNAYAIVIGIENYRQRLPKADFAAHDAKTMTEYLTKVMGFPEENVITLINDNATKSDFEKYFGKWLKNNVEKDAFVFIYYSGHGAPNTKTGDAFLVPYDGDPAFMDETGYSLKRLYASLEKLQAKEIIVALDSCFSGAGGKSVIAKGARPLVMNIEQEIKPLKNLAVMSASSGDEISSTYEEKGHGLFTYYLLKGLKGEADANKDGRIEIGELYEYLRPLVGRTARKVYNNDQSPKLFMPVEMHDIFLR